MRRILVMSGLAVALLTPPGRSDDKPKAEGAARPTGDAPAKGKPKQSEAEKDEDTAKTLSELAALGPGVHAVKKDSKGRVTTFVVVGQARVSTALGKAKGLEVARDKAKLDASAQVVKWLGEKVSVHQTTDEETILFIEGSEDNDKDALRESGKAVEKSTKKIESVSQGVVRGLQSLHVEVNADDKTYTVVLGWEAKTADAAKELGSPGKDGADPKKKKPADKKLDGKKATSPDAKKFLP